MNNFNNSRGFTPLLILITVAVLTLLGDVLGYKGYQLKKANYQTEATAPPTVLPFTPEATPTINPDPIIDCNFTHIGTMKLRRSVCLKSTDCQIGSKWIYYSSVSKCKADQNAYNNQQNNQATSVPNNTNTGTTNAQNYPPCVVYYPVLKYSQTFYIPPDTCTIWQQQAIAGGTIPTIAPLPPTPEATIDNTNHNNQVQQCRDSVNNKYSALIQSCYQQFGGSNSAGSICVTNYTQEQQQEYNACGQML